MTIHYQIYELTPSFGDGLICEGKDRDSVIRAAIEWTKDEAADNDVTEWELDAKIVEMDWDNDVILSEKNIYKCGVLN